MDSSIDSSRPHTGEQRRRNAALPAALLQIAALLFSLMFVPTCRAEGATETHRFGVYYLPSTDRPPVHSGGPLRVPVKALVQRLAFGSDSLVARKRSFRYDLDTLGQGLSLRLKLDF